MKRFVLLAAFVSMSTPGQVCADAQDSEDPGISALRDQNVIFVGFHPRTDSYVGRITFVALGQSWKGGDETLQAITDYPVMLLNLHRSPEISDATLAALRGIETRYLKIQYVQITDKGLDHLTTITGLKSLTLKRLPVTDAGIPALSKLKTLKRLNLWGTQVTMEGAAELRKALPDCDIRFNAWNRIE
ncbi:MAG: hypothetical protein ABGZ53_13100 [Fuerstiella sp.]